MNSTSTRKTLARKVAAFCTRLSLALAVVALVASAAVAQEKPQAASSEHDDQILGVRIGMSVPDALKAVYEHTATEPAPARPDALKEEGKDKKDIRVVYKNLKEGELQIVFAGGKAGFVREMTLVYAKQPAVSDLRLPLTTSIEASGNVLDSALNSGTKIDDRYSVGFTDDRKTERFWWRDEPHKDGYAVRIGFVSGKLNSGGAMAENVITRKVLLVKPGDEGKFWKAVAPK
jgi:hypothetical protein